MSYWFSDLKFEGKKYPLSDLFPNADNKQLHQIIPNFIFPSSEIIS